MSINTLNSNRLIRNTRSESIAQEIRLKPELIASFFLLFRESMRWNAVVVFPVSVRIYESLITGPSLHCQPPLLQDKQNDFVYTARHVCAFVQTSNCVSHEGEIDCLTAAA